MNSADGALAPITLRIPTSNHDSGALEIDLSVEDRLFIVGANGSGKSALIQHIVMTIGDRPIRRISAHRQTWLSSAAIEMTPKSRRDANQVFINRERNNDARWKD